MCDKNLFPRPSPFDAPSTRPAISTKVISVFIIFSDFAILAILFNLSSGTDTTPILGSIVQNGKFAASAFLDLVIALKVVDLPTFGKPIVY